jgi:hypothetical protein
MPIDSMRSGVNVIKRLSPSTSNGIKTDKSTTQRNTTGITPPAANILNVESSKQSNVLNSYRSYTYNFTLSAVDANHANNPAIYRSSEQKLVILKTGGKGSAGISTDTPGVAAGQTTQPTRINPLTRRVKYANPTEDLINDFNKESPGRFDMYIDNVEITTLMAPNSTTGLTLPSKISFDVFEPYSINGFIEALQVTARAAGYPVYSLASFLLKIEFIGYKDNVDLPLPQPVENSSRYFLIQFAGMNVELTENGTKYSCRAIPFSDRGFGETGRLQSGISMSGNTVGETLKNLMDKLSGRIKSDEATNKSEKETDSYYIKFPKRTSDKGLDLTSKEENPIASSKISKNAATLTRLLKHDAVSTGTSAIANTQGTSATLPTFQFKEGVNIHEIIASTVRDSEYVKNIIENIATTVDDNGMINYFLINIHVENKSAFDDTKGRPFQIFTYVVTEHKVHYTFIPPYGSLSVVDKNKLLVLRDYNYIYTGKNLDITTFKLDYNYLYFEAIPRAMGRNNYTNLANSTTPDNANQPKDLANRPKDATQGAPIQTNWETTKIQTGDLHNSGQPDPDSYAAMAKNMHLALINSVSRMSGELDIIGDPFYLVTGGIGNYNPPPSDIKPGITKDNEADRFYGQVYISLKFKNPVDINPTTGLLDFSKTSSADASGVFMVTEVASSFKDGAFKQKLKIIRIPGQLPDNYNETNPSDIIKSEADPSKISAEVAITKGA